VWIDGALNLHSDVSNQSSVAMPTANLSLEKVALKGKAVTREDPERLRGWCERNARLRWTREQAVHCDSEQDFVFTMFRGNCDSLEGARKRNRSEF
jgi:hypothetical protein